MVLNLSGLFGLGCVAIGGMIGSAIREDEEVRMMSKAERLRAVKKFERQEQEANQFAEDINFLNGHK